MNNEYCVYKITNKLNGKIYIGMTKNLKSRWRNNGIAYKPNNHKTSFHNAIQKYGWDNFYKEILNSGLSFEEATKLEKEYIKLYNTRDNSKGYNIAEGGNGGILYLTHPKGFLNKKHTDEWKNEHSKRMTGVNNPFYNKNHSVESKVRMIEANSLYPVYVYNSDKILLVIFPSVLTLAKKINSNHRTIVKFIKNQNLFRGE